MSEDPWDKFEIVTGERGKGMSTAVLKTSPPKCPKCGAEGIEVNGLYWKCRVCGAIDDSTFDMIMAVCEAINTPDTKSKENGSEGV